MKKIIIAIMLLLTGFTSQAQISMPATYKYTKKIFGNPSCPEVTSYFIFRSYNDVIWCLESTDGYIFPVAFGAYSSAANKITFTQSYSSFGGFRDGNIVFNAVISNGSLILTPVRRDIEAYFDDNGKTVMKKCDYDLEPSNKLVGTSWKFEDYDTNDKILLYFKSKTEVLLDGEPRGYILMGNTIGILCGDNPGKEALVGTWNERILHVHRSGITKRDYPWFELDRIN